MGSNIPPNTDLSKRISEGYVPKGFEVEYIYVYIYFHLAAPQSDAKLKANRVDFLSPYRSPIKTPNPSRFHVLYEQQASAPSGQGA